MLEHESAQSVLRNAGVRLTPQRLMILDALVGNTSHPTIDDIYLVVQEKYPTVSLATVYHTIALLAQHGLILELHGGKDGLRCDPETAPHGHAYCQQCGTVTDIPLPRDLGAHRVQTEKFQVAQVEFSVYGRCQ
ncbi:MAG TPA: Fur family transcriptional regulator, partial [Armatimonadota bacterium]